MQPDAETDQQEGRPAAMAQDFAPPFSGIGIGGCGGLVHALPLLKPFCF
jgi:hypothetical protein